MLYPVMVPFAFMLRTKSQLLLNPDFPYCVPSSLNVADSFQTEQLQHYCCGWWYLLQKQNENCHSSCPKSEPCVNLTQLLSSDRVLLFIAVNSTKMCEAFVDVLSAALSQDCPCIVLNLEKCRWTELERIIQVVEYACINVSKLLGKSDWKAWRVHSLSTYWKWNLRAEKQPNQSRYW